MNKKYKIALLSISVLLFGSIFLGTSYSIWQSTNVQEGINEVKVGCFKITFTNLASYGGQRAGDINLVNAYPISDENGASLVPYIFNIKNECTIASDFKINLETLNTSTFNTEYLRIKFNDVNNVTNNTSSLYTELEESNVILTSQSSAARLLTTGHLEENESATYSLRVWVDKVATVDTPNVMGKTWNGKVVVTAEATNPKEPEYTIVSGDLDTVGSVVKIGTEEFYVIGQEDSSHVKLLSKLNLNVGNNIQPGEQGIQNSKAIGYNNDSSTSVNEYYPATVAFSSTNYWHDSANNKSKNEYGGYTLNTNTYRYNDGQGNVVYPYVYDSNSNLYQYVNNYVTYLNTQGVNVSGRLIKQEELVALGCNAPTYRCDSSNGGTAPSWVYQTSYWSGSADGGGSVWGVDSRGISAGNGYVYGGYFGVRPVIILEK